MMVQDLLNTCMPRQLRRRATTLVRNVRICVCIQQMQHHAVCTEEHRMAQSGGADLSRVLETRHCLPALSSCKDIAATQPLDDVEDATRSAWLVDVCLGLNTPRASFKLADVRASFSISKSNWSRQ